MTVLKLQAFGGMVPRVTKRDLPDNAATLAVNLLTDTMEFRPLAVDSAPVTLGWAAPGDTIRTMYRYPTNSDHLVGASAHMSLVRSTIAGDAYDRVYVSLLGSDPQEIAPHIAMAGRLPGDPTARLLGVPYPAVAPTLAAGTSDDKLLTPSDSAAINSSLMQRIIDIASEMVDVYPLGPIINVANEPGFRPVPGHSHEPFMWQRVWTQTWTSAVDFTWNTHNGAPVENFMWVAEINSPPFYQDSPQVRTFYANIPLGGYVVRVRPDVSLQRGKLQGLYLPGSTVRVLTDADIDELVAVLRRALPDNPMDTDNPELKGILTAFTVAVDKAFHYLKSGIAPPITPQAALQLVQQAAQEVFDGSQAIADFYQRFKTTLLPNAILAYFKEVHPAGVVPVGELPETEVRFYTYTWVNPWGEESKPYLPGDGNADVDLPSIECNQASVVLVTRPPLPPEVGQDWKWRIYRSATGADGAGFFFVAELPVSTATYTDIRPTEGLSESLRTMTWFPPPTLVKDGVTRHLRHLVQMPGQFLAGFVDNTVYFSEPGHPYAWPPMYAVPVSDPITALGVFGATLVVLTQGRPVYISGDNPITVSRIDLESVEQCISPRSVTAVTGGVVFASQNGVCMATQQGIECISRQLFTRHEWEPLLPGGASFGEHDGVLYMAREGASAIMALDAKSGKLALLDIPATALYTDYATRALYAALPTPPGAAPVAVRIAGGEARRVARWRSKRITLPAQGALAWMAVEGEQSPSAPLTVDVYAYYAHPTTGVEVEVKIKTARATSGADWHSAVVTDTRPFRMAAGRFKDYEVELSGTCRITSVALASTTEELKEVN